jgi:nucleotide-binding universal stress UspA family protein
MSNIRCIVAATDFSTFSERAVQRAAHIARQHDAELHLLHVVRPLDLYPSLTLAPDTFSPAEFGQRDQVLQEAEHTRLDDMASGLTRQFGIRVRAVTRLGRPHTNIAAYAQEASADLLVVGSRGENTLM